MIGQATATVEPGIAARTRMSAGRAGLRFAHACCCLLILTLVWAPHWPFYRFGLAPPPYGILDIVFAPADLLFVGLVAGWGLALVSGQDRMAWSPRWISGPLALFVLASGLAIIGALDQDTATRFAIRAAGLAMLYLYLHRGIAAGRLAPDTLVLWLVPGLAFNGLLAIAQTIHQNPVGLAWLGEPETLRGIAPTPVVLVHGTRLLRAFGLLPHPNALGGLLAAALPLVAGLLLSPAAPESQARARGRRWGRVMRDALLLLSVVAIVAGIMLSFSRSAWLGLLCAGLYLLVWRFAGHHNTILGPFRTRAVLLIAGIGLVIAGTLAVEWDAVSVRLQPASNRLEQTSIQQRLALLELSFQVISRRPLTGVGGDNFALAARRFLSPRQPDPSSDVPVHNTYLLAEAELGPLGGVTWLALMLAPLLYLLRQRSRRRLGETAGAAPPALEGVGQSGTAGRAWTAVDAPAARVGPFIRYGATPRGDQREGAPHDTPAPTQWQGLAGCSLIVVAVVGLFDWYIWGNGPGNEPVAVLWVIALAVLTAPVSEPGTRGQPERWRASSIVGALALLAILALAIGACEYLYSDRVLPKVSVNTVNINVGGQTQDAVAARLRPFSLTQRFRAIALIVRGQGRPILVPAYKLGYSIDTGLTAWRAYNVGHSGSPPHRLMQLARTLLSGARVPMAQHVDETALHEYLFTLQGAVNRPSRPGIPGRALNVALAQRQLTRLLLHKVGAFRVRLPFVIRPALSVPLTTLNDISRQ